MDKHTPTPWYVSLPDDTMVMAPTGFVASTNLTPGTYGERHELEEANAALIVKAVNSHASLTEAVRVLTEALEHAKSQIQHPDQMIDEALTTAKELTK